MIIRQASLNDINHIIQLTNLVADIHGKKRPDIFFEHPYHITKEKLERFLTSDKHLLFVAELNKEVVGVVLCTIDFKKNDLKYKDAKILRIEDTCISQEYRRKKIGTALISVVLDEAKKQNCHRIESNVWAFNAESLSFFKSNGFSVQQMTMELSKKR